MKKLRDVIVQFLLSH